MSRAANTVMRGFATEFTAFQTENKSLIDTLDAEIGRKNFDEFFWDLIEDLKGLLSSQAANMCASERAQWSAIDACEQWVADEYSGRASVSALSLWLNGLEDGAQAIRKEILRRSKKSKNSKPTQ